MTPSAGQNNQNAPIIGQNIVQKLFDLLPGLILPVALAVGGSYIAIQRTIGDLEKDLRAAEITIKETREDVFKISQRNQDMAIRFAEVNGDLKNVLESVKEFKEQQRNQYNTPKR